MKDILTRNLKEKLIAFAVGTVVFLGLHILSVTLLSNIYIFDWMSRNHYCFAYVPMILLIVFDKTFLSYFVTFGNLAATIIGEVLGNFIRNVRMSGITDGMDEGEKYFRSYHHGVFIWLCVFLGIIVIGIVLNIILGKRKKPLAA